MRRKWTALIKTEKSVQGVNLVHNMKPLGSAIMEEFLDQQTVYKLLGRDCGPWNEVNCTFF
jgi:hypothetical protein